MISAKPALKPLRKSAGVAEAGSWSACNCGGTLWGHAYDHVTLLYGHVNHLCGKIVLIHYLSHKLPISCI